LNVDDLYNNKGYWLWIEDNLNHSVQVAGYSPIDNNGEYYTYHNI